MKRITPHQLLAPIALAISCSFILSTANSAAGIDPAQTGGGAGAAENSRFSPLKVDRLDASIDRIIPADAKLERLASGFTWVEGPVWVNDRLFFAEIPSNSIRTWTPGKGVRHLSAAERLLGSAPYGGPESGSNGMTLDLRGRLTVAGHAQRDVYRFESLDPKGPITILADTYQGKRLNSPNDVVYKSDGSLYFTDPPYGLRTQQDSDPEKQLERERGLSHSSCARAKARRSAGARLRCNCWSATLPGPTALPSRPTKNISTSITRSRRRSGCVTA